MRPPRRPVAGAFAVAAALSLVWIAAVALFALTLGTEGAMWLALTVAAALPLAGIWFGALLARQSARLAAEAERLAETARTLAATEAALRASAERPPAPPEGSRRPAEPPRRQPAGRVPGPLPAAKAEPAAPRQESLPLAMEPAVSLSVADLARALDFPDSEADREGFRMLRLALRDPRARRLVQASQDVLTLLAADGVYMDDLRAGPAQPGLWRGFAAGERSPAVAAVGSVREEVPLELAAARMRADPVFRDAAHHFLRHFDGTLAELAPDAGDDDLARLADTRTARAFMLLGRAAGIFDESGSSER